MTSRTPLFVLALAVAPTIWMAGLPDSASTNLIVGLAVQAKCGLSVNDMDFGTSTGEQVTAQTSIKVQCTVGTNYKVAIDAGNVFVASTRNVSDGTDRVPYSLYSDAGMTLEWGDAGLGDTYPAGNPVGGVGTGAEQIFTVHGKVPAFTSVPAGNFQDTVAVTVNF